MITTAAPAEVLAEAERSLQIHGRVVLCQIVRIEGSTPGKVGWKLLARPDGSFFGNLGGGAFEALVMKDAGEKLSANGTAISEIKRYYLTEEAVKGEPTGMVCGGHHVEEDLGHAAADHARGLAPGGLLGQVITLDLGGFHALARPQLFEGVGLDQGLEGAAAQVAEERAVGPRQQLPAGLARGRAFGAHDLAQHHASLGLQGAFRFGQNLGRRGDRHGHDSVQDTTRFDGPGLFGTGTHQTTAATPARAARKQPSTKTRGR
jgi:xanthine/CO dehydrogenase XdhC/CoxF family maturation factor